MHARELLLRARCALPVAAALAAASCAGGNPQNLPGQAAPAGRVARSATASPISHVILVIQENRSFDDFFATFPGADGTTTGKMEGGGTIPLQKVKLAEPCDFGHSYNGFRRDYDGGQMDGFGLETGGKCAGKVGKKPYQYVNPTEIAPYWDIAQQFVLADHMFQTQGSGSFTAHQDLIAGGTIINAQQTESLIDFPSAKPWGCDAPSTAVTSYLLATKTKLEYRYNKGPFPCLTYETMRDLLDAQNRSRGATTRRRFCTTPVRLERLRRDPSGARGTGVDDQHQPRKADPLRRHERNAAGRFLGRSRSAKLRPSGLGFDHGPFVGCEHRERRRRKFVLGFDRDRRRLGRLRRLLRPRAAAVLRSVGAASVSGFLR